MLRGGRSREPLSRHWGLTWDEFLDELEQIERLGPHSAPGSAPGSPAASPVGPRLPLTHTHSLPDAASGCWSGSAASSTSSSPSRRVPSNTHLDLMVGATNRVRSIAAREFFDAFGRLDGAGPPNVHLAWPRAAR